MQFKYPCSRCGFCCISETCPVGQRIYEIEKHDTCPGLSFKDGIASCQIALIEPEIIGVGAGCCIKATAIKDGVAYDFASLAPFLKKKVAQRYIL
jgi:hypothetical protein